jgi:predicted O-methyltransferase YrrM
MSLRHFFRYTALGRVALIPFRLGWALTYCLRQAALMTRWAFTSKEYYNHTCHLTELNRSYLVSYIAVISGHDEAELEKYVGELEKDEALRSLLEHQTLNSWDRYNSDVEPRYGRRLGWYALVRATKPRVIVETGVDRGLGTAVLAAAVRRNEQEGFPGLVYATDIVPDCGHLLAKPYTQHCRILLGDSVETLKKFSEPVDIFLHDSDHRPEYEWAEFVAIEPRLHPGSIVMSDNSQQSPKMREFAQRIGKSYLYFQDQPKDHWWPGDGIGAAFVPGVKTVFQAGRVGPNRT